MIITFSSPYSLSFKSSFQNMTSSLHLFSCKPLFQRYFTNISPTTTQTKRWGHPSFLKMSGSPDCFLTLSIQNQNFQEPKPQKTTTNTNQNVSLSLSSAIRMSNEVNFIISLIWVSLK